MRSFVLRGSNPQSRATVELRPSAATSARERKDCSPAEINQCCVRGSGGVSAVRVAPSKTVTPSSRARRSKSSSKKLRLIAISASSPPGSSAVNRLPLIPINSTRSSLPWGKARTCSANSNRRRIAQQAGFKQSPQTFSRGKVSRSRRSVRRPFIAQKAAQLEPAGPPPTIATSNMPDYVPRVANAERLFHRRVLT
jgi:hypothetical protein